MKGSHQLMAAVAVLGTAAAVVAYAQGGKAGTQAQGSTPVRVASNLPAKPGAPRATATVNANAGPAPSAAAADNGVQAHAAQQPAEDSVRKVLINRETYAYPGIGRRDPFVSLMTTDEIRPILTDLKLVAVALDPQGRNSVAVLRDMSSKEQFRVRVGEEIGRMRVAAIHEKSVVFGIEEFGYSRRETLAMNDSSTVRTQ